MCYRPKCVEHESYEKSAMVVKQMDALKNRTKNVEKKPENSGLRLRTDKSFGFRQFDFEDPTEEIESEGLTL